MFKFFVITRAQKPGVNNVPDREVCEDARLWASIKALARFVWVVFRVLGLYWKPSFHWF